MINSGVIYCFTNLINGKKYIGQTLWEKQRYNNHKNCVENSVFHRAILKYGFENFKYEILFESDDLDELNKKEIEYIEKYNSLVPNGYNVDKGGRNCHHSTTKESSIKAMSFAKGVLSEDEVIFLRKEYLNNGHPVELYNKYFSDRFNSFQAFMNIWCGKRYSYIMPEVFELRKNKHTKLNKEKAHEIKELIREGKMTYREIGELYGVSRSTIQDIQRKKIWKDA